MYEDWGIATATGEREALQPSITHPSLSQSSPHSSVPPSFSHSSPLQSFPHLFLSHHPCLILLSPPIPLSPTVRPSSRPLLLSFCHSSLFPSSPHPSPPLISPSPILPSTLFPPSTLPSSLSPSAPLCTGVSPLRRDTAELIPDQQPYSETQVPRSVSLDRHTN